LYLELEFWLGCRWWRTVLYSLFPNILHFMSQVLIFSDSNPEYNVTSQAACDTEGRMKGTAIPLQAFTGPEGSSRLRLSDFKTICT
jgi:hypothetical protein